MLWRETPVYELDIIGGKMGKTVFAKMECFQQSGSFKARGIGLMCKEAVEAGAKHIICSSGGNAGYTAACAGRKLNVRTTVLVPEAASASVRNRIAEEGAEVIVHGVLWEETNAYAMKLANAPDTVYIPPFDHSSLWRGHATMIDEVVNQCPKPDAIVLSVGGGGLLCGVIEGLCRNHWGDVPIVAVETAGAAAFRESIEANKLVKLDKIDTIALSLAPGCITEKAFEWTKKHDIRSVVVTDASAVKASLRFADDYRVLVEPACGASLSILYENHEAIRDAERVLVIACGGIGVTVEKLEQWRNEYEQH